MGTLISKNMGHSAIFTDLDITVNNSAAAGGKIAEIAAAELLPVYKLIEGLEGELAAAKKTAAPLVSMVDATRKKTEDTVQFVYDLTWNRVGRPAMDPKLSLLFPSGASHYIVGDADKLPDRVELLAGLFEKGIHPNLTEAQYKESSDMLRAVAHEHRTALDTARAPLAAVELLERTRMSMGKLAQVTLSNFKRMLKAASYNEARIHEIIPNHAPVASKKAAPKKVEMNEAAVAVKEAAVEAPVAPTPVAQTSAAQTSAARARVLPKMVVRAIAVPAVVAPETAVSSPTPS